MLIIRLARVGKRNKAQFKIMVQEKNTAPGGRHVEILGSYNPHSKETVLKKERIDYWLSQGAQTSDTVYNLLVTQKVIEGKKRPVKIPAKKVEKKEEKTEEKVEEKKETVEKEETSAKNTDKETEVVKEEDEKVKLKEEKKPTEKKTQAKEEK